MNRASLMTIAGTVLIASTYFALTWILAPISFLPFQVRFSDSLIMLSAVFGEAAAWGVFLGCIIANCFPVGYPPNIIDVVFGSLANLISGYVVMALTRRYSRVRLVAASLISSLIVTIMVGTYLPIIILPKFTVKDILFLGYLGVLPGELVAQAVLGVWLVEGVRKLLPKMVRR